MKNILVTGGLGFIGSNFIKYILEKYNDYMIVNLDAVTYAANFENVNEVEDSNNYSFVKGNICDETLINDLFNKYNFDYVINFAAESHVDRSLSSPEQFALTNINGTINLLNACKKYFKSENNRYIQISTDEVYGSIEYKSDRKFKESDELNPNNPYSSSKASGDLFVLSYIKTYNLPAIICRSSNNYGPYQNREKLIPLMIYNAIKNIDLPVYGDGLNIRDWIYVKDNCKAIDLVLHKGKVGQIYNIGSNNLKKNIDVVKVIVNTLDKNEKIIKYVKDRLGHDKKYAIDNSKIVNELGFKPDYEFDETLIETIKWYERYFGGKQ